MGVKEELRVIITVVNSVDLAVQMVDGLAWFFGNLGLSFWASSRAGGVALVVSGKTAEARMSELVSFCAGIRYMYDK